MSNDALFERRRKNFVEMPNVDEMTALNLAIVAEVLDILEDLQGKKSGSMIIQTRQGEWKSWDAEVYGADEASEGAYIRRLKESPYSVVLLSEEAGRVDLTAGKKGKALALIVARGMIQFSKTLGFPVTLAEAGVSKGHIRRMIQAAKDPQLKMKLQNMPTPMDAAKGDLDRLMRPVLEAAFTGDLSLIP